MLKKNLGVIIAAGGSSQRYGDADKLTEMLDGIPVFVHSIRRGTSNKQPFKNVST